jgi:hypothetical protein
MPTEEPFPRPPSVPPCRIVQKAIFPMNLHPKAFLLVLSHIKMKISVAQLRNIFRTPLAAEKLQKKSLSQCFRTTSRLT